MHTTLKKHKHLISVLLSLLIHFALILISEYLPKPIIPSKSIEVEILQSSHTPSKNQNQQQVVRAPEIPIDKITESKKTTDFLSEKTIRVKEQMRAQNSGLTQNRSNNTLSQKNNFLSKVLPRLHEKGDELSPTTKRTNPTRNYSPNLNNTFGISTTSDDLSKDIKIGDMTVLDTDQYLYYSFINRAGESFYYEWAPMVQSILESPPVILRSKGPGKYTTVLEVWFLPNGKIHSTHIMKPSGIPEFDFVATRSFKTVAMVPNPPKQKLDADGFIRFTWQLSVNYESKALVHK